MNKLIDKFHLDASLKPVIVDRNETALHPKVQTFLNEFSLLGNEEKIVLMQSLSNARYKNHEIYYFLPSFLLSRIYPELKEYINYRGPDVERILAPKGIRVAMDLRKSEKKLASNVECVLCEHADELKPELQKAHETAVDMQKLFFLQMDQTESMRGDHTALIFINKEIGKNKTEAFLLDSAGTSQKFMDRTAKFVHSELPEADIRGIALARQVNMHSCLLFVLGDAQFICENPQAFLSFVRAQEAKQVEGAPYKTFDALPPKMMKLSQTGSALKRMQSESQFSDLTAKLKSKGFLISAGENPQIEQWRQKGCLITYKQLAKSTNVYANHLFAKIERKVLEKVFT